MSGSGLIPFTEWSPVSRKKTTRRTRRDRFGRRYTEKVEETRLFGVLVERKVTRQGLKAAPITPMLRGKVYAADSWQCCYCGYEGPDLSVDHIMPQSRGGITSFDNSLTACRSCNSRKSDRTPQEAGMRPEYGRFYVPSLARLAELTCYFALRRGYTEAQIIAQARADGLTVAELSYAYARYRNWSVEHCRSYLLKKYRQLIIPRGVDTAA
jgi:5-methylcytosine-specific restriction endonuclease McrA